MSFSNAESAYVTPLWVLGVNHRTTSVETREALARLAEKQSGLLSSLHSQFGFKEGALISTCNRFEVVGVGAGPEQALRDFLVREMTDAGVPSDLAKSSVYHFQNRDAVRHLFRVASSVDSMALGEAQILGQVKDAYRSAVRQGCVGRYLHALFQFAFRFAKKVRGATAIGSGGVSMSFVAVKLAQQIFGDLSAKRVLLIGSGEMAELTALHMKSHGCRTVTIANRTIEKAIDLAARVGGSAISLSDVVPTLDQVDMVISSIRTDSTVIEAKDCKRRKTPLFLVDLGMPRNLSPALAECEGVYLYSIDDLGRIADENLSVREAAAKDAEVVIEYGIYQFERWLQKLIVEPDTLRLRARIYEECEGAFRKLAQAILRGEDPEELISQSSHMLSQRVSHELVQVLRTLPGLSREGDEEGMLALLFDSVLGSEEEQ